MEPATRDLLSDALSALEQAHEAHIFPDDDPAAHAPGEGADCGYCDVIRRLRRALGR